jgi:NAD-dependent dihydropyrimidine dehydrogenase PreA subunit
MQDLMKNLKDKCIEIHNAGGMDAVDRYLDEHHRLIPWESCFECDSITPRDPQTLKCFFEEELHEEG